MRKAIRLWNGASFVGLMHGGYPGLRAPRLCREQRFLGVAWRGYALAAGLLWPIEIKVTPR